LDNVLNITSLKKRLQFNHVLVSIKWKAKKQIKNQNQNKKNKTKNNNKQTKHHTVGANLNHNIKIVEGDVVVEIVRFTTDYAISAYQT
jgi:translation initiation factor IF-1